MKQIHISKIGPGPEFQYAPIQRSCHFRSNRTCNTRYFCITRQSPAVAKLRGSTLLRMKRCLLRGDIRYVWSVVWDRIYRCFQPALERIRPCAFHPNLPNYCGKFRGRTAVFVPQADPVTHYHILAEEHRPRAGEAGALAAQPLAVNRSEHCYLRANVDEQENFLRQYILG